MNRNTRRVGAALALAATLALGTVGVLGKTWTGGKNVPAQASVTWDGAHK